MPPFHPVKPELALVARSSHVDSPVNPLFILPSLIGAFALVMGCMCLVSGKRKREKKEAERIEEQQQRVQQELNPVPAIAYQPGLVEFYGGGSVQVAGGSRHEAGSRDSRDPTAGNNDGTNIRRRTESDTRGDGLSGDGSDDNGTARNIGVSENRGTGSRHQDAGPLITQDFEVPPPAYTP